MIRILLLAFSIIFAEAPLAQTEGPPAAASKLPTFKTISASYFVDVYPIGRGMSLDLEIAGPVSKHRMQFGIEHRNTTLELGVRKLTTLFFDYVWYERSPHIYKFFIPFYEAGIGLGLAGDDVKYFAVDIRGSTGARFSFTERINLKLALDTRVGMSKFSNFNLHENEPWGEIGILGAVGFDLY
jgi:hypothetical protein